MVATLSLARVITKSLNLAGSASSLAAWSAVVLALVLGPLAEQQP